MGARYKLSQAFIKSCGPGKYNDGAGLWLHKRSRMISLIYAGFLSPHLACYAGKAVPCARHKGG